MTTARSCVRGLLIAALLPEAPRWGRSVARFSPRFADRQPASTAGVTHFTDSPQWWGVAPHVEHPVVEGDSSFLACHPSVDPVDADHGFGRTCRRLAKRGASRPPARLQNRACEFPRTRLLGGRSLSRIPRAAVDAGAVCGRRAAWKLRFGSLQTLCSRFRWGRLCHSYPSVAAGLMTCVLLLGPLPSDHRGPRRHIPGITPGLSFLGDPTPNSIRLTPTRRQ